MVERPLMIGHTSSISVVAAGLWLSTLLPAQDPAETPPLVIPAPQAATLDGWQQHIWPTPDEVRWMEIPWHATFGDGLAAAGRAAKPLLFWAMNGHPLGCT